MADNHERNQGVYLLRVASPGRPCVFGVHLCRCIGGRGGASACNAAVFGWVLLSSPTHSSHHFCSWRRSPSPLSPLFPACVLVRVCVCAQSSVVLHLEQCSSFCMLTVRTRAHMGRAAPRAPTHPTGTHARTQGKCLFEIYIDKVQPHHATIQHRTAPPLHDQSTSAAVQPCCAGCVDIVACARLRVDIADTTK